MNLQKTIDTHANKLTTAQKFSDAFAAKLPGDFPGILGLEFGLSFTACIPRHAAPSDCDRLLAACGDVFGREGWTRKLSYERTHFDWRREILGVEVTICGVENINEPREGSPVLPNSFPVLLPETASE